MTRQIVYLSILFILFCGCSSNQPIDNPGTKETSGTKAEQQQRLFRQKLDSLIRPYKATIGVAIMGIEDGDTITVNNEFHYPMQSVYKFPLAIAVLNQVDKGKLYPDQKIYVRKQDLHPSTWSPLRTKYPGGNINITIAELLNYTVSKSDNNACDILFGLLHGPKNVEQYIHECGINEIAIAATEHEMSKHWDVQFTNWTKPFGMVQLLNGFYHRKYLSDSSNSFLMKLMIESSNSAQRIKGLLPEGTIVAHKTGTSNTNEEGETAATNDVGIITLPNGKHFALAVFLSNTLEKPEVNERIIAEIAKAAFVYFEGKGN